MQFNILMEMSVSSAHHCHMWQLHVETRIQHVIRLAHEPSLIIYQEGIAGYLHVLVSLITYCAITTV